MEPTRRDAVLVALAAVFAGATLTASLVYRARRSHADAGVGPGPGPGTRQEAAAPAASAADPGPAAMELRTNTLQVNEPPPPGQTGPARPLPKPDPDALDADLPAPPKDYASRPALDALPDGAGSAASVGLGNGASVPAGAGGGSVAQASNAGSASAPPPAARGGKSRKGQPPPRRSSDAGLLDSDPRLSARAVSLVHQAKDFKVAGNADGPIDFSNPQSIRNAIVQQQRVEDAVDSDVRQRLQQLGPSADIEQQRQAVADVLAAHGQPADDQAVSTALGTAMQPSGATSPAQVNPADMDQSVESSVVPHPAPGHGPAPAPVLPEYRPSGPPPADALKAYQMYKGDFDAALQKYGVRPEHILALGQQESDFGKNMGRTPELKAVQPRPADFKAVFVLAGQKNLPAPPAALRGSSTGALGPWQFEPSTCLSVNCAPFDWHRLISDSVPRELVISGYKAGNPQAQHHAFCRYYGKCNDGRVDYANDIERKAAAIKAGIDRLGQGGPVAAAKP